MMIYLDNAATSLQKPPEVAQAVASAINSLGSPSRGAYAPALAGAREVFATRAAVAQLLHAENASTIAFTHNATYALNMALQRNFTAGDHIITSVCEHNSVLRPLYLLEQQGVQVTRLACDEFGRIAYTSLENAVQSDTKAIVLAHAGNVTGNVINLERIGAFARAHKILLIVDAAQMAGCYPIDVQKMNIDILCFTGHKALLGPTGTGGMYVRPGLSLQPLLVGGSGVQSFLPTHPREMPTALEAGTLNVSGIAGLHAGVQYLLQHGVKAVHAHELALARAFYERVSALHDVKIYGDWRAEYADERVGIVTLNIGDVPAGTVADDLFQQYGICTRAGAHCAPLLHEALGTAEQGAVRFSFGIFNTMEEVHIAADAIERYTHEIA